LFKAGRECQAILGGKSVLEQKFIPYIFMKWSLMFERRMDEDTPCPDKSIRKMISFLVSRGFHPHRIEDGKSLKIRSKNHWKTEEIMWKHRRARWIDVINRYEID